MVHTGREGGGPLGRLQGVDGGLDGPLLLLDLIELAAAQLQLERQVGHADRCAAGAQQRLHAGVHDGRLREERVHLCLQGSDVGGGGVVHGVPCGVGISEERASALRLQCVFQIAGRGDQRGDQRVLRFEPFVLLFGVAVADGLERIDDLG